MIQNGQMNTRNGLALISVTVVLLAAAMIGDEEVRKSTGIGCRKTCPLDAARVHSLVKLVHDNFWQPLSRMREWYPSRPTMVTHRG